MIPVSAISSSFVLLSKTIKAPVLFAESSETAPTISSNVLMSITASPVANRSGKMPNLPKPSSAARNSGRNKITNATGPKTNALSRRK
jgi:hypothetical protein